MLKAAARFLPLLIAVAGFGLAQPAMAEGTADISTPAWVNHDLPLYVGPGKQYDVRGVLPGGLRVSVDRCSQLWCRIHFAREHGYVFLYSLSFGQGPNSIWWPQQARHPGVKAWQYYPSAPSF